MKKNFLISLLVLLIALVIFMTMNRNAFDPIEQAISKAEAKERVKETDSYFVISPDLWTTGTGWKIIDANKKSLIGKEVKLAGMDLRKNLTSPVLLNNDNKFLIQGEYLTNDEIYIVSWDIVAPITRDYLHQQNKKSSRYFSPSGYIDEFDVSNGDFVSKN